MAADPAGPLPVIAWLRESDSELLAQCELTRLKGSGPGGQRRNKVETAVRLKHLPTGVVAEAAESRSAETSKGVALGRLRLKLARTVRSPFNLEHPELPPELVAQRSADGRLAVNPRNPVYPVVIAVALDALAAAGGRYAAAARALGLTTSQLVKFLDEAAPGHRQH